MFIIFLFSSRRRHTRCSRDWSSDVCSSDLEIIEMNVTLLYRCQTRQSFLLSHVSMLSLKRIYRPIDFQCLSLRSEERRVGKSVDLGGRRIIKKKKNGCRSRSLKLINLSCKR